MKNWNRIRGIKRSKEYAPFYERVINFGLATGRNCEVCRLAHPLAMFYGGWKRFPLCMNHTMDSMGRQYKYSFPPDQYWQRDPDVVRLLESFQREGVAYVEKGLLLVEGREQMGRVWITEIRSTTDSRMTIICMAEKLKLSLTHIDFQRQKDEALVAATRMLLRAEVPA